MKGILFKPDMIQAIVEGRKTQTRRVIKPQPDMGLPESDRYSHISVGKYHPTKIDKDGEEYPGDEIFGAYTDDGEWGWKSHYQVGETVYIKEAWATEKRYNHLKPSKLPQTATIFYVSDGVGEWPIDLSIGSLRSPLHLPEEFARYFIKITDVRAERLQEITEEDALKEGITIMAGTHQAFAKNPATNKLELIGHPEPYTARYHYESLWDSLNKDYPWESNPWVFRYEFEFSS